jgi:hypothetical protein
VQLACLDMIAKIAEAGHERLDQLGAVREAASFLLDARLFRDRHHPNVFGCLINAARLANAENQLTICERYYAWAMRCRIDVNHRVDALSNLSSIRRALGDLPGAVRAACQQLRLDQDYSVEHEGVALLRLAWCARELKSSYESILASLADERIGRSARDSEWRSQLRLFSDGIEVIDEPTSRRIEHDYRADRGARLLREAFGVDVAEIDALNERLGDATEEELRGFLLDVQQYCTR